MGKIASLTAILGTAIAGLTFYFSAYLPHIEGQDTPASQAFSPVINIPENNNPSQTHPLTAKINAVSGTSSYAPFDLRLIADVTGGTPPYYYSWYSVGSDGENVEQSEHEEEYTIMIGNRAQGSYALRVTDSAGQSASDSVQMNIQDRPE